MTTLNTLPVGSNATIKEIEGLDQTVDQRLLSLGMVPGVAVRVVQVAPLGDPIAVEFQGRTLGLRSKEASGVRLEAV